MGEVWRAWDTPLGRWVALKFLRNEDPAMLARFLREARTAARLNHPAIAAVYEVGETDDRHFIAMQLIQGKTLARHPKGDVRRIVALVREAASAVHYAHEQGVIHRDLKPDNIMVEERDGRPRVFVMDFGLAKHTLLDPAVTGTGLVAGTPSYMPPEQATGQVRAIGPRSDVYALGATLYDLLCGGPPFRSENAFEVLRSIVQEEPPAPRKRNPGLDAHLETIILKCLEKWPASRYAGAAALAGDLTRWLDGEPIQASPPSTVRRLGRAVVRRWGVLAGAALAALAASGALLIHDGIQRREARAWEAEARRRAEEGRYEEAKTLLDRAAVRISIDPRLYQLCESKLAAHRTRLESTAAEEAVFGPIRTKLALLRDRPNDWAQALELLDEGLRRHPGSSDAWLRKARLHENRREYEEALSAYEAALRLDRKLGEARYLRGRILLEVLHRPSDALREFEAVEESNSLHAFALLGQAQVARIRGNFARVLSLCDRAEREGSRQAELYFLRGHVTGLQGSAFYDFEQALRHLSHAIHHDPRHVWAHLNRGSVRQAHGDAAGAFRDYSRAIELDPRRAEAWTNRGTLFYSHGAAAAAAIDFARASSLDPSRIESWSNRAALLQYEGRHADALSLIDTTERFRPLGAGVRLTRGQARLSLGDALGALGDFAHAIALQSDAPDSWRWRAEARLALGDFDGAIRDLDRVVHLRPQDPDGYNQRGRARRAKADRLGSSGRRKESAEEWTSAVRDHEVAIRINPRYRLSWIGRAHTLRMFGSLLARDGYPEQTRVAWRQALENYGQAIALAPRILETRLDRANLSIDLSKMDPAAAPVLLESAAADFRFCLDSAPREWGERSSVERRLAELCR